LSGSLGFGERRQQQCRENGDHCNDDKQLDEREAVTTA